MTTDIYIDRGWLFVKDHRFQLALIDAYGTLDMQSYALLQVYRRNTETSTEIRLSAADAKLAIDTLDNYWKTYGKVTT